MSAAGASAFCAAAQQRSEHNKNAAKETSPLTEYKERAQLEATTHTRHYQREREMDPRIRVLHGIKRVSNFLWPYFSLF